MRVLEIMDEVMGWLRANGIEPTDVPITAVPTVRNGRIICPVYLRRNGKFYLDGDDPARGRVDVPLLVEATSGTLKAWLAGKVPA